MSGSIQSTSTNPLTARGIFNLRVAYPLIPKGKAIAKPSSAIQVKATQASKPERKKTSWVCRATQTTPRYDILADGEPVAIDIEFQTCQPAPTEENPNPKWIERIGRIAVVNMRRETVFDAYFAYDNEPDMKKGLPPRRFNVWREDLRFENGAIRARDGEKIVKRILENRSAVFHDSRGDVSSFYYERIIWTQQEDNIPGRVTFFDTQEIYRDLDPRRRGPGLADAYMEIFGEYIQRDGIHSPVEDAAATMRLFLHRRPNGKRPILDAPKRADDRPVVEISGSCGSSW